EAQCPNTPGGNAVLDWGINGQEQLGARAVLLGAFEACTQLFLAVDSPIEHCVAARRIGTLRFFGPGGRRRGHRERGRYADGRRETDEPSRLAATVRLDGCTCPLPDPH